MNKINKIIDRINDLLKNKDFIVIAIDGKCGSGKTTLASKLESLFDANVIHCDDFYLPLEKRTDKRYEEPGGNIDYERFKDEIIDNLDKEITYHKFDCKAMSLTNPITLPKKKVLIIEGAYSLHPYFDKYYDLSIFIDIDSTLQLERLKNRESIKDFESFINKWIPLENKYFETFNIKDKVDYIMKAN